MRTETIIGAVQSVTKKWAKQRKAEEREASRILRRREVLTSYRGPTIVQAASRVMKNAYLEASTGGKLPAHARQIMYKARPHIEEAADRKLDDQYFTQKILPNFVREHPEMTSDWDVVFDARGHLKEPHTKHVVDLGTLGVRRYLADEGAPRFEETSFEIPKIKTKGPCCRYSAILFIEKEGFMPLFEAVNLAERYDIAIMSTKGVSVVAARKLADDLCSKYNIPLLVLHDFDKAGFSIVGTLRRDTQRYSFSHTIRVIDLGLRLQDVEEYDLVTESVYYRSDPFSNLRENGATNEEIEFLRSQRVELNAFSSGDLVEWIEAKLEEHDIAKVIPEDDYLEKRFRQVAAAKYLRDHVEKIAAEARRHGADVKIPSDLRESVEQKLEDDPTMAWEEAVQDLHRVEHEACN